VRVGPLRRLSVRRVFGQTSLLVYWVHVELVYGLLFKRLANRLSLIQATGAFVLMTAAMLGIGVLELKYWRGWKHFVQGLRRRFGRQPTEGNLPSARPPL